MSNIEELRRKVIENQKERLTPEQNVDYILNHKNARNLVMGLIQDKYGFSDINDMVYLIAKDDTLTDKQKLSRITNLTEVFVE